MADVAAAIDEHVDVLSRLCEQGHVASARAFARGLVHESPLVGHVAMAAVAAITGDLPTLSAAVVAAQALAPDHAAVLQAKAVMHALAGDAALAYDTARAAYGAGATAQGTNRLARLLLSIGKRNDGLNMLETLVAQHDDPEAHMQLGGQLRAQGGAAALEHYVAAFMRAPTEPATMSAILNEIREASWPIGVAVLARHLRATSDSPSLRVVADVLSLAARLYLKGSPHAELVETRESLFARVLEAASAVPAGPQLVLAGLLLDLGRDEDAQVLLTRVAAVLSSAQEHAHHAFLLGRLAQAAGQPELAIARFEAALGHDPHYTNAACNLIDVLVSSRAPNAEARSAAVVASIPEPKRRLSAIMTYNEASLLEMQGKRQAALELVAFLLEGPLGVLDPAVRAMQARLSRVSRTS